MTVGPASFSLAEAATEVRVARVYVDQFLAANAEGDLTAAEAAARSTGPPTCSSA